MTMIKVKAKLKLTFSKILSKPPFATNIRRLVCARANTLLIVGERKQDDKIKCRCQVEPLASVRRITSVMSE